MARHHLTLAAVATALLPDLDVAAATPFTGGGDGEYDSALLTSGTRHLVVRVPLTEGADRDQIAEGRALAALTAGVRARLPFAVTTVRGAGVVGDRGSGTRAVVRDYVPGQRLRPDAVEPGSALSTALGAAIAAIHALPTSVVATAGLAVRSAADMHRDTTELVERVVRSGRVPVPVAERWRSAVADASGWRFRPTVVHGALALETILVGPRDLPPTEVTGVLGWGGLSVGDPALDLAWTLALPHPAASAGIFGAYAHALNGGIDADLARRAMLHAELGIGRWLLHGLAEGDETIVRDADAMLRILQRGVEDDTAGSLLRETRPVLSVEEVERMLDRRHPDREPVPTARVQA